MKKIEIEKPAEFMDLVKSKNNSFLYYDHPSDGIDYFNDPELENIGWNACTFPFLNYRKIAEFMEETCEGTLTYNDGAMGFNGFAEIEDIVKTREQVKAFVIEEIKNNKLEEYDDDQIESLEYFGINL